MVVGSTLCWIVTMLKWIIFYNKQNPEVHNSSYILHTALHIQHWQDILLPPYNRYKQSIPHCLYFFQSFVGLIRENTEEAKAKTSLS